MTLTIVPPPNDAPIAVADLYSANVDTVLTVSSANGVLSNDSDGDNDPLTAELITDVIHGTLTLNSNGSFSYTPIAGFTGTDTFQYVASDTKAESEITTVTILVNSPNNQVPLAVADAYLTNHENVLVVGAASGLLANDSDNDIGDTLTTILDTDVNLGTLSLNTDGSFTYIPIVGFGGDVSFSYFVSDGQADSAIVDVVLTVEGPVTDEDLLTHFRFDDNQDPNTAIDSLSLIHI